MAGCAIPFSLKKKQNVLCTSIQPSAVHYIRLSAASSEPFLRGMMCFNTMKAPHFRPHSAGFSPTLIRGPDRNSPAHVPDAALAGANSASVACNARRRPNSGRSPELAKAARVVFPAPLAPHQAHPVERQGVVAGHSPASPPKPPCTRHTTAPAPRTVTPRSPRFPP